MHNHALKEHGDISSSVRYIQSLGVRRDARVLDVGTRFGTLLQALKELGYAEIFGVDIDPALIEAGIAAHPDLRDRLQPYDGRRLPFADASFDVLTMFDVLEHIPDVAAYLREVRRVLRPGGQFIFQTPNRYINIPWEIAHSRSLTRWRRYHCSLQTVRSLRRRLNEAGFNAITIGKHEVLTAHKQRQVREKLGRAGVVLLHLFAHAPLFLTPNLWGHAVRH